MRHRGACPERLAEFGQEANWGYRPGRLVSDPANGKVYLITTDGLDRGLPNKRWITMPAVLSCFGWSASVMQGTSAALADHPDGAKITSCTATGAGASPTVPTPRVFPNGSLINVGGTISMIEVGKKRHVINPDVYSSWFSSGEAVTATTVEASIFPDGTDWGFRPGRIIRPAGDDAQYVVTDDGVDRARGTRRHISDPVNKSERGYDPLPVTANVGPDALAAHPVGLELQNADNIV